VATSIVAGEGESAIGPLVDATVLQVGRGGLSVPNLKLHSGPDRHSFTDRQCTGGVMGTHDCAYKEIAGTEGLQVLVDDDPEVEAASDPGGRRLISIREQTGDPFKGRPSGQRPNEGPLGIGHHHRIAQWTATGCHNGPGIGVRRKHDGDRSITEGLVVQNHVAIPGPRDGRCQTTHQSEFGSHPGSEGRSVEGERVGDQGYSLTGLDVVGQGWGFQPQWANIFEEGGPEDN